MIAASTSFGLAGRNVGRRWHDAHMTRTARYDHIALAKTLKTQLQVISRPQSLACGLSVGAIRHRTRPDGPWRILLPGVYLVDAAVPSIPQREIAATLYAGEGSMVTGIAALTHHGIRHPACERIDVLVPAPRKMQSIGFARIWRTTRLPERPWTAIGIRYAPPPRAVADAALTLATVDEVRAIVADAVQRNKCTVPELAAELSEGPVRGSARFRQALEEVTIGVRSVAEGDLRRLLQRGKLPMPYFNAKLYVGEVFLAQPDAWWPDAGLAVEVDSREWHLSPSDWEHTMHRHAQMSARGIIVLHFTPRQISRQPDQVLTAIGQALKSAAGRPALDIRTVPLR
jgi:very-short-patch-repair endonuclease